MLYLQNSCGFFAWFDPPTCPRGMEVGRDLMKKVRDLESENKVLKQSITLLKRSMTSLKVMLECRGLLLSFWERC